jgi:hypothetical protein
LLAKRGGSWCKGASWVNLSEGVDTA